MINKLKDDRIANKISSVIQQNNLKIHDENYQIFND